MKINIKNVEVNYVQYGEGKDIILLHGWGQNIEMMKPIGDNLCDRFRINILDLPGFGDSEEPKTIWKISDYSEMLEEFIKKLNILCTGLICFLVKFTEYYTLYFSIKWTSNDYIRVFHEGKMKN